mmetsp:Transcript_93612/g.286416  ORF Transcript_93612/g.286416 Transcript_93612/m.286416 type:complete len:401 (+) Transcript_93612:234-1436(+)
MVQCAGHPHDGFVQELLAPLGGLPRRLPRGRQGGVRVRGPGRRGWMVAARGVAPRSRRRVPGRREGPHQGVGGEEARARGHQGRQGQAALRSGREGREFGRTAVAPPPSEALRQARGRTGGAGLGGAARRARRALAGAPAAEKRGPPAAQGRGHVRPAKSRGSGLRVGPLPRPRRKPPGGRRGRLASEQRPRRLDQQRRVARQRPLRVAQRCGARLRERRGRARAALAGLAGEGRAAHRRRPHRRLPGGGHPPAAWRSLPSARRVGKPVAAAAQVLRRAVHPAGGRAAACRQSDRGRGGARVRPGLRDLVFAPHEAASTPRRRAAEAVLRLPRGVACVRPRLLVVVARGRDAGARRVRRRGRRQLRRQPRRRWAARSSAVVAWAAWLRRRRLRGRQWQNG